MPEVQPIKKRLSLKKADLLFVFDRVLKDPDPFIIMTIVNKYPHKFAKFIDIDLFDTLTMDALSPYIVMRQIENPLEWAAIKEFDYEKNYRYLHDRFKNMYRDSKPLHMVNAVKRFINGYCINNIYIWNEKDDERQRYDICSMFPKTDKIKYVTGDYANTLKKLKPNIVYDWSAKRISEVNEYEEFNNIFFGLSNYRFNFEEDGSTLKYNLNGRANVAFFKVMDINENSLLKG